VLVIEAVAENGCCVWIEPPSPRRSIDCTTGFRRLFRLSWVGTTLTRAVTAPRGTLLCVTMLTFPVTSGLVTLWTVSRIPLLSKEPPSGFVTRNICTCWLDRSAKGARKVSLEYAIAVPVTSRA
jgi:hypothetical protein